MRGLRALRIRAGLKQKELAALLGVTPAALAQAVLNLLAAMEEAAPQIAELMMIARDGKVTGDEVEPFDGIVEDLDDVVQAALAVKYAERTAEGGGEA